MIEFLTSRSRRLNYQRCQRARFWLDEWKGTGLAPVSLAVPLVTGGSVHVGLASLLDGCIGMLFEDFKSGKNHEFWIERSVDVALEDFRKTATGRNFDVEALENQSYVFNEQLALVEALVRLAGMRIVPKLLKLYEVLEVERMDVAELVSDLPHFVNDSPESYKVDIGSYWKVNFRSIPDALLRERTTGDLYLLSWKTSAEFDQRKDQDARVDMQGLSEAWAVEERLGVWQNALVAANRKELGSMRIPQWFIDLSNTETNDWRPSIRGVQMVYLIKGQRRKRGKEDMIAGGLTEEQIKAGGAQYKTASPLIYGYINDPSGTSPKFAFSSEWRCTRPHSMRKSQYYPTGECPGDGRNHKRGEDWKSFPVWELLTTKTWMEWLGEGTVTPEAGDALDQSWAMPVPHYRTRESVESWLRQTRASESRIARALVQVREYESVIASEEDNFMREAAREGLEEFLDQNFEQSTEKCGNWFGRLCPAWNLCWGPGHIAKDPVGSGLYQIKEQYQPEAVDII
jgi:hypothetical protein